MKKSLIKLIMTIIFCTLLSGCWSSKELNELSITTAIGIDKSEEGVHVTLQIINPGEVAAEATARYTAVTTYSADGKTVFEAIRRLTLELPRRAYQAHVRLLVFGEEYAREGIGKALDFFSRDHEFRTDFYVIVAKEEKAEELLKVLTPLEKITANKIYSSLEISEKSWAPTKTVQLDELISSLVSEGKQAVITGVEVQGEPETGSDTQNVEKVKSPVTIKISNIAVFKKDKLIGWLNEDESKGLNYVEGNVTNTVYSVPCKGGRLAIEVIRTKSKVKGKVEDNKPHIDIKISAEGNVGDVECEIDLSKTDNIYKLEQLAAKVMKKIVNESIKKAKDFQTDIFGFGEVIHRTDYKYWAVMKEDWDNKFKDITVNINVEFKIRRLGTINKSFQKEAKE